MNFSFSITSTLLIFLSVSASVIFFTEIYTEIYPIFILVFTFFLLTLIKLKRIIITKSFLTTVFLFLILILYYSINRNNGVIYDFDHEINSKTNFNIIDSLIIFFFTFLIGYFYSLQVEYPLKIFSKVFSIQLIVFFIYVIWLLFSEYLNSQINLSVGVRIFIFLPFFIYAFDLNSKKVLIFLYIVLMSFLTLISNRASMIAISMFFINYSLYPYLLKSRVIFKSYFFINCFFIFIIFSLYLALSGNEFLNNISLEYFNKRLNTRAFLWVDLIEIIKQKILFGFGSDQMSENIAYYGDFNRNNLSSHSAFLEIVLRAGIFGLFIYLLLLYSIYNLFYSYKINFLGRIGSSLIIGMLYMKITATALLTGNIVHNAMIWLLLGIVVAQVTKANKLKY
jgi:hypothetical protein